MKNVDQTSNYSNLKLESLVKSNHLRGQLNAEAKQFELYKPESKNFDSNDTKKVLNYENQGGDIKSLDLAISPFMKNQNDHMQRMHLSVARQEQIA